MGADLFSALTLPELSPPFKTATVLLPPLVVEGHLVFRCAVCKGPASFGLGVNIRAEKFGTWFCAEHKGRGI